jgi:hypothetical protein
VIKVGQTNSNIYICKNIKLDKSYKDVLTYTEAQMVALCQSNAVASASNYSFIRSERNVIKTSFNYNDALKCNYMAFQNPDYSNKWFFAFIDDVIYANDGTCKIQYTIDEFSTWYDYWNPEPCFVEREHVNDDTVGLHTIPEGLECGEYIINSTGDVETNLSANEYAIIGVSWIPDNSDFVQAVRIYGGVYSGLTYFCFRTFDSASNFINAYTKAGHLNDIINMFMLPQVLTTLPQTGNMWINATLESISMTFAILPNTAGAVTLRNDINLTSPNNLNGYVPKNNKLLCYPYNALTITNNAGTQIEYRYEDFVNNNPIFSLIGVPSPSGSVWLYPNNYKKNNTAKAGYNWGIPVAKYPQGSWQGDQYTNWMTQNGINLFGTKIDSPTAHAIGGSLLALTSAALEDYGGIGTGLGQMFGSVQEQYKASMIPNTIGGQINSGDVTYAFNKMSPTYYKMTIKEEYARIIDDWFSRFGYKINRVKLPNQKGRTYWNYVQIGASESIGYSTNQNRSVPASSMDMINNIYRKGTTLWHSHDNIGNYSLTNNIV